MADPDFEKMQQTQNSDETQSGESTEKELDDLIDTKEESKPDGREESETKTDETEIDSTSHKEEKKQRDYKKAFEKILAENKELKSKMTSQPEVKPDADVKTGESEDEGVAQLRQIIREESLRAIRENQGVSEAIEEVSSKPYFNILGDKVLEKTKTLTSGSAKEKLETAYNMVVAENIDTIVNTALKVGQQDGFKNRIFKKSQGTVKETPSNNRNNGTNDQQARFATGDLTDEEYKELREDGTLERWEKEELGVN